MLNCISNTIKSVKTERSPDTFLKSGVLFIFMKKKKRIYDKVSDFGSGNIWQGCYVGLQPLPVISSKVGNSCSGILVSSVGLRCAQVCACGRAV